jgi:membrane protein DedA with SNARE-associated domain
LGLHWGHFLFYLGLGTLLTAEEAGVFLLPGDISMVAAGVYAAQGGPFILFSWVLAALGMVAGACILFFSVRRHRRSGEVLPTRVRVLIQRHGAGGIAVARLVPGLRNATVFAAAAAGLSTERFLLGLIPAAVVWTGVLLGVGWFGGTGILELLGDLNGQPVVKLVSIGLVLAAAIFWLLRLRSLQQRKSADVE